MHDARSRIQSRPRHIRAHRLQFQKLRQDADFTTKLQALVSVLKPVTDVRVDRADASIVVHYNENSLSEVELLEQLAAAIKRAADPQTSEKMEVKDLGYDFPGLNAYEYLQEYSHQMKTTPNPYSGYRYPAEVISHDVWLYFRFTLSYRDAGEGLAARGIVVSHETVRQWCLKFGQQFAKRIRSRQPRPSDTWFLDEVFITINGELHYLCRAVDQDGDVLDILVQKHRDKRTAKRFFPKLLKGLRYAPRRIVTDKLRSYGAALKEVLPDVIHDNDKWQNNRAEMSHQPTRPRERQMRRFKSAGQAQRFVSAHGPINNLFRLGRHHMKAVHYRPFRDRAFDLWREVT